MNYWLVKSDPDTYGWPELVKDGWTFWDGVRNYAARINLRAMEVGDLVLFYHSQSDKAIVGTAEVIKAAYQDPTTDDDRWVAVDIKAVEAFKKPVTLAEIKAEPQLSEVKLIKQTRLSVMPITAQEWKVIIGMSK